MGYHKYAQSSTRSPQRSLYIVAGIVTNNDPERGLFMCSFLHVVAIVDILNGVLQKRQLSPRAIP